MPGLAILAGYGLAVLAAGSIRPGSTQPLVRPSRGGAVVLAALLFLGTIGSYVSLLQPASPAHGLTDDERVAMAWTISHTPPDARFLVITGSDWSVDAASEWFPTLTDRVSVATVQGYEWFGRSTFAARTQRGSSIQDCALASASCIGEAASGLEFDYIFIPNDRLDGPLSPSDCCAGLRATLIASPGYRLIYDDAGASILERVE